MWRVGFGGVGWWLLLGIWVVGCTGEPPEGDEPPKADEDAAAISGTLGVASGLRAEDYIVMSPLADDELAVGANGAFAVPLDDERVGVILAVPRDGTPSSDHLQEETGIYLSPSPGFGYRLGWEGSHLVLRQAGEVAVDAYTTILSLVLMHPSLATPSTGAQIEQLAWMTEKARTSGWAAWERCARAYDAMHTAGEDGWEDPALVGCLAEMVEEVEAHMPEVDPDGLAPGVLRSGPGPEVELTSGGARPLARFYGWRGDSAVASSSAVASDLKLEYTWSGVRITPSTHNGTALEYFYFLYPLDDEGIDARGRRSDSFRFAPVDTSRPGAHIRSGVLSASSYWGYVDIVGNSLSWVTDFLGFATGASPDAEIVLPLPSSDYEAYELRLFSGGFDTAGMADWADEHFPSEASAAFQLNVSMAVIETLSLIPGADALLGDSTSRKVVQEATTRAMTEIIALRGRAGSEGVSGEDLYQVLHGICETALNTFMNESSSGAQERGVKRFLAWVGRGGKRAVKTVLSLPGKVAKGGTVANRAYRLARPSSVMERYVILLERGGSSGALQRIGEHFPGVSLDYQFGGVRFGHPFESCEEHAWAELCMVEVHGSFQDSANVAVSGGIHFDTHAAMPEMSPLFYAYFNHHSPGPDGQMETTRTNNMMTLHRHEYQDSEFPLSIMFEHQASLGPKDHGAISYQVEVGSRRYEVWLRVSHEI